MHVLIADDHRGVRENLRALLTEQQPLWELSEARNGKEAVEIFRQNAPDVAVLDIVMDPMGGVAAAHEIRQIDPNAKIIFISSHYAPADASFIAHFLGAGAFVSKPEAAKLLVPTIKRPVNRRN